MLRKHLIAFTSGAVVCGFAWYFDESHIEYQSKLQRVNSAYVEAQKLERSGNLQGAYAIYSPLCEGGIGIDRSDLPIGACDGARRLTIAINDSYKITMSVLNQYRVDHGRYPDTLKEIREAIPKESLSAFDGFRYVRESDSKADLITGLYGSQSFSLGP